MQRDRQRAGLGPLAARRLGYQPRGNIRANRFLYIFPHTGPLALCGGSAPQPCLFFSFTP